MLIRADLESSIHRKIPKHMDSNTGDEDMAVMRYERRTVPVGKRPRTALVEICCDSVLVERTCEDTETGDDVGSETSRRELWWTYRGV